MVKPIFVVTPTPTPVPTPSAETGKLRFYAVKECGIYLGNKERLAEFLLDPVNDTLEYNVTWKHYEAGDTMELRGYTTQCTTNYGSLLYTLPGVSGSWSYSTSLDEGKLVIGSEYETGQVHLAITQGSVTTRAWLELDRDDDGLTDQEERYFSSSRTDRDSDEDGLMDGEEAHGWGRLGAYRDIITHPAEWDTDGDGLSDGLELGMQFEDRITSFTKNVTPISSTLMDGTDFDDNDPADGLDDVNGWRFEDADPNTTTNPARPDTDLDGFWDGPDIWVISPQGLHILRIGEDKNADGKYDPYGEDAQSGTTDDETDTNAQLSAPSGTSLSYDRDLNGFPDEFDDMVRALADEGNFWFGVDLAEGEEMIRQDALIAFGDPSGGAAAIASIYAQAATEEGEGTYDDTVKQSKIMRGLKAGVGSLTNAANLMGKIFTEGIVETALSGFDNFNPDDGEIVNINTYHDDNLTSISATFVNGMDNSLTNATDVGTNLNTSYAIPVSIVYNPEMLKDKYGGWLDAVECVRQTGYNVLLFLSPTQLDKTCRQLKENWRQKLLDDGKEDLQLVHFCHSQGAIITAPALWWYRLFHHNTWEDRMQVVVFGSGYSFLDFGILPKDRFHFVYTEGDGVYKIPGGRFFNPYRTWNRDNSSKIINFVEPSWEPPDSLRTQHSFWPEHYPGNHVPNTYGWWTYYIGGPIFRHHTGTNIHGEKKWLSDYLSNDADLSGQAYIVEHIQTPDYTDPDPVPSGWARVVLEDKQHFSGSAFNPRMEFNLGE